MHTSLPDKLCFSVFHPPHSYFLPFACTHTHLPPLTLFFRTTCLPLPLYPRLPCIISPPPSGLLLVSCASAYLYQPADLSYSAPRTVSRASRRVVNIVSLLEGKRRDMPRMRLISKSSTSVRRSLSYGWLAVY